MTTLAAVESTCRGENRQIGEVAEIGKKFYREVALFLDIPELCNTTETIGEG